MLLLTLAIIDDIAAILVIAFFYSERHRLDRTSIVAAGVAAGSARCSGWASARALVYVIPAAIVWYGMLRSRHAPDARRGDPGAPHPGERELRPRAARPGTGRRASHPSPASRRGCTRGSPSASCRSLRSRMPGVSLEGLDSVDGRRRSRSAAASCSGWSRQARRHRAGGLPRRAPEAVRRCRDGRAWSHTVLLGLLGGIGFTMSIFIANLAFPIRRCCRPPSSPCSSPRRCRGARLRARQAPARRASCRRLSARNRPRRMSVFPTCSPGHGRITRARASCRMQVMLLD